MKDVQVAEHGRRTRSITVFGLQFHDTTCRDMMPGRLDVTTPSRTLMCQSCCRTMGGESIGPSLHWASMGVTGTAKGTAKGLHRSLTHCSSSVRATETVARYHDTGRVHQDWVGFGQGCRCRFPA